MRRGLRGGADLIINLKDQRRKERKNGCREGRAKVCGAEDADQSDEEEREKKELLMAGPNEMLGM